MKETKNLATTYFPLFQKIFGFKGTLKPAVISLHKPWQSMYTPYIHVFISTLTTESVLWVFYTIAPIWIGRMMDTRSYESLALFCILFFVTWFVGLIAIYFYCIVCANVTTGLRYEAYRHFITSDPINHTNRSSGVIISKIQNGVTMSEDLLDIINFDVLPLIITTLVVIVSFALHGWSMGMLAGVTLLGIILSITIAQYCAVKIFVEPEINQNDTVSKYSIENLQQIFLIRSSFAATDQLEQLYHQVSVHTNVLATAWMGFISAGGVPRLLFRISFVGVLLLILTQLDANNLGVGEAAGLAVAYFSTYNIIVNSGQRLEKFLTGITKIKDLFTYAQAFGRSDIPVESGLLCEAVDTTPSLTIHNMSFSYPKQSRLYDHNSLVINLEPNTPGLYGLIGPSGTGKSTLMNIIGGQLKPQKGEILINDINPFSIAEFYKKQIIAMQMQTSSTIQGTLRDVLHLGLETTQNHKTITDDYIQKVLAQVGLWDLFSTKQGLDTVIGEGGVNLSGGQRQRLNFAGLYIRAKYFKPLVILIDEPTSSLDEVSEQYITAMIEELSRCAITIVVAHRLQTLEKAIAIMDTTLIKPYSYLEFMTRDQLVKKSSYYHDLITGKLTLE